MNSKTQALEFKVQSSMFKIRRKKRPEHCGTCSLIGMSRVRALVCWNS